MASWEPVDIDPTDSDGIRRKEDGKWDGRKMNELEVKLEELRQFNARLEELLSLRTWRRKITLEKCKLEKDTTELIANEVYDKMTTLINKRRKRLGTGHKVQGGGEWAGKICLSGDSFLLTLPLKRDEKASGPPHYILQNQERPPPPLVIVVRSIRAIRILWNDMTVGHYRSYGTRMAAVSWIMRLN